MENNRDNQAEGMPADVAKAKYTVRVTPKKPVLSGNWELNSRTEIGETNKLSAFNTAQLQARDNHYLVEILQDSTVIAKSQFGSKFSWHKGYGI